MTPRVIEFKSKDLIWPFEKQGPYYITKPFRNDYGARVEVDAFPCYAHNKKLVEEHAAKVIKDFPMSAEFTPTFYTMPNDTPAYTNGWTTSQHIYNKGGDKVPPEYYIVLAGKRIPPHPGMTRYLVAHEYGHVVEYYLRWQREFEEYGDSWDAKYGKLRKMKDPPGYGGLMWHKTIGELFANDFRILVTKTELEFWPHDGFAYPTDVPAVVEFWEEALGDIAVPEPN